MSNKIFDAASLKNKTIYWIGGSPCSGKSSVAEILCEKFDFHYYKCDDFLENYLERGVSENIDIMNKFANMDLDQTWINRSINEQVSDEFLFYKESFKYIINDLCNLQIDKQGIIVEGAALLPQLICSMRIPFGNYVCIIPTKEFQVTEYSKRDWAREYLKECSDPEIAFKNWMQRDINFAEIVKENALELNMNLIVENGDKDISFKVDKVIKYWSL